MEGWNWSFSQIKCTSDLCQLFVYLFCLEILNISLRLAVFTFTIPLRLATTILLNFSHECFYCPSTIKIVYCSLYILYKPQYTILNIYFWRFRRSKFILHFFCLLFKSRNVLSRYFMHIPKQMVYHIELLSLEQNLIEHHCLVYIIVKILQLYETLRWKKYNLCLAYNLCLSLDKCKKILES